jgi:uncharacterized membrane protein YqgA involved in biofilm formation
MQAIGLMTVVLGLQRAVPSDDPLVLLLSLVIGATIGELLRIEDGLERLGGLANRFSSRLVTPWAADGLRTGEPTSPAPDLPQAGTRIGQGFLTASLLFCVGPMTILGSFEDGLTGAYQTLAVKAILDGVAASLLASTLGWGVLLASVTVLVYQGTLTMGASFLRGLLTDGMIGQVTAVGGVLIFAIGLNLLNVARIRVASLLPALAVAPTLMGALGRGG